MSERVFEVTRVVPFNRNYCVSESGKVGRIGTTGWLRPSVAKRGQYLTVSLWHGGKGHTVPVHQIVAVAFLGPKPSPKHEVAHWDGVKPHCHWRNLRWATRAENEADKVRHGTANIGERNGQAKLTDEQVRQIKARPLRRSTGGVKVKKGELQALAAEFGVSTNNIWQIINDYRRAVK